MRNLIFLLLPLLRSGNILPLRQAYHPYPACWMRRSESDHRCQDYRIVYIRHEFCKAVYFIHHQKYRFATSSQHISHFGIGIYQSLAHIGDKNNNICGINRDLCLISHLRQDDILALRLDTAGIDPV